MGCLLEVISSLKHIKSELEQRFHVSSIGIFGSVARGEDSPGSDVDILVDFSEPVGVEFIDLADFIEKKINRKIDLVSRNGVKPKYFHSIQSEIVNV